MIKLNLKLRKNVYKRKMMYGASVESRGRVTMNELAARIAARCTATKSDILAVLASFQEQAKFALRNGQAVSLSPLGTLRLRCHSKLEAHSEDFDAGSIKGFTVGFRASGQLRRKMQRGHGVEFDVKRVKSETPVTPAPPATGE